ncbi:MAG: integrase family protein [Steroidobacteraceae bacterium]
MLTPADSVPARAGPAARLNLVRATIEALQPPARAQAYYSDSRVRGLQLVVTARGVKSWYLYRRTGPQLKPKRHFLGRYPDLTPELARRRAEQWSGIIATGGDPSAAREAERARGVTLAEAYRAFRQVRGHQLKPRTLADYGRFLESTRPDGTALLGDWQHRAIVSIAKDQVGAKHRALTANHGAAQADHAMRFLRALINFARFHYEAADGTPLVAENPVQRLSQTKAWNRPKRRSTYVKPHQLRDWFRAVEALREGGEDSQGALVADYLELLILTGLRRGEAAQLRRADVDLEGRTLTVRDSKNREDHTLPLSDRLLELMRRRLGQADPEATAYVFPGDGARGYLVEPRRPIRKVIDASDVQFSLHDLRRTFATIAEGLDISAYSLKRLLNHKMRSDVTAGYVVTDVERLRKPMQQITDNMLVHAGLRPGAEVIALEATERLA